MSENKFETVSSLVDNYQTSEQSFDEIIKDAQSSDTWDRYHLMGDVLRNETSDVINFDLSNSIAEAIANEPTILAPKVKTSFIERAKAKVVQFSKPLGQVAIAASATGLMILGVQTNVAEHEAIMPVEVVKTIPLGGIAEPVSLNYQQADRASQKQAFVEQQRRFHALLADHKQQVKLSAVQANTNEVNSKELTNESEKAKETLK